MTRIIKKMMLCAIAGIIMISCNPSNSKTVVEKNILYGNLELFQTTHTETNKKLIGVKDRNTGKIILSARECDSITADRYVIFVHQSKYAVNVFKHNGQEIGSFELFSYWKEYYLGTNYKSQTYYFPKTEEAVKAAPNNSLICEGQYMILKTNNDWQIRERDGNLVYKAPLNSCIISMEVDINKSEISIVIPTKVDKNKKIYIARSLDNEEIGRYTEKQWMNHHHSISKNAKFINFDIPEESNS